MSHRHSFWIKATYFMQCDKVKKQKLLDITTEQAQDYRQKHSTNQIIFNKINRFAL